MAIHSSATSGAADASALSRCLGCEDAILEPSVPSGSDQPVAMIWLFGPYHVEQSPGSDLPGAPEKRAE